MRHWAAALVAVPPKRSANRNSPAECWETAVVVVGKHHWVAAHLANQGVAALANWWPLAADHWPFDRRAPAAAAIVVHCWAEVDKRPDRLVAETVQREDKTDSTGRSNSHRCQLSVSSGRVVAFRAVLVVSTICLG